jgi:hypothetical protein
MTSRFPGHYLSITVRLSGIPSAAVASAADLNHPLARPILPELPCTCVKIPTSP